MKGKRLQLYKTVMRQLGFTYRPRDGLNCALSCALATSPVGPPRYSGFTGQSYRCPIAKAYKRAIDTANFSLDLSSRKEVVTTNSLLNVMSKHLEGYSFLQSRLLATAKWCLRMFDTSSSTSELCQMAKGLNRDIGRVKLRLGHFLIGQLMPIKNKLSRFLPKYYY